MSDPNTVIRDIEPVGVLDKIGGSIKGIGVGLFLVVAASALLYWNEGRTVERAGAIAEAELVCVDLPNIDSVDASLNGKVVYAKGLAKTSDTLSDPQFGVSATAIGLDRKVQYYQWVENKKTEKVKSADGKEQEITTYSYQQKWIGKPVNSGQFHNQQGHYNTVIMQAPLESEQWYAENVTFGAYTLPPYMVRSISHDQNVNVELTDEQIAAINKQLALPMQQPMQNMQGYPQGTMQPMQNMQGQPMQPMQQMQPMQGQPMQQVQGYPQGAMQQPMQNMQPMQGQPVANVAMVDTQTGMPLNRVYVQGNSIYLGQNQGMPQIGDMKIEYIKTPDTNISLVAQLNGNTFEPYITANGGEFSELSSKQQSKKAIFQGAKDSNSMMAWILRGVALMLTIMGFKMVFGPLVVVANYVPILGSFVEAGVGIAATLLGVAWALIIFAISWVRFRPMLAIVLIAIAVALIGFAFWKGRSKQKAELSAEA